jgi:predicted ArsR family transcriptional regulator
MSLLDKHGAMSAGELAKKVGLSQRGATFLLSKLKSKKKL